MARYEYKCPTCELRFEVSRPMSEAGADAFCPVDNTKAERIFSAPVFNVGASYTPPNPQGPSLGGYSL